MKAARERVDGGITTGTDDNNIAVTPFGAIASVCSRGHEDVSPAITSKIVNSLPAPVVVDYFHQL